MDGDDAGMLMVMLIGKKRRMLACYMKALKAGGALSFAMGHSMALSFATLNS